MTLLEKINTPKDLKQLDKKQLKQLCSEIREYMISCCASNPGHLGSSLGTVELTVALHYIYNTPEDKLIWDVGHQAYTHKIITGRKEAFKNNRKKGGLSGFPKRSESKYDAYGGGHSSTSISAALGIAVANDLLNNNNKTIAIIGDGSMTGGLAFEGLNNAGFIKKNILVILNDNQIAIDKNIGALHNYLLKISTSHTYNKIKNAIWNFLGSIRLRTFIQKISFSTKMAFLKSGSIFQSLGFRYFGKIDGNNIDQLISTLTNLKDIEGPKLLHIATKKGKGYKPAEENQVLWHAPGLFDKGSGNIKSANSGNKDKYQTVFGETLLDLAKKNDKIIGITPAMLSGCSMNIMMKELPERTFDVGIAESHAVTFSAGLATEGMLPFCNIYSSFMQRAYDNIIQDVAIQNLKVIFCIDRGGIVGEDGSTHHGTYDLSYMRIIPNMTVMAPLDEIELKNMMYSACLPEYGPCSIRYPRGTGEGVNWRESAYEAIPLGKAKKLKEGKNIAILSIGAIGNKATQAIREVEQENKNITILHYDVRFLKPFDYSALDEVIEKCHTIITIEDGSLLGGLHSTIAEYLADKNLTTKLIGLGIPDKFIEQGAVEDLISECGYNVKDIKNTICKVLLLND